MRATLLVLALLVGSTLAFPAEAAGPVAPTLQGPSFVHAARNWTYSGQLVVDGPGAPVPLSGQTVGLYVNGARQAWSTTDAQGRFLVSVSFPVGSHTVRARAFEGSALEAESAPLTVWSAPTWPAAPGFLQAKPGFHYTSTNVTWYYPWTDGGYPVTSYTVERSVNGGPFSPVFTGNALAFVDPGALPGNTYVYRATSTTSWGTSNTTQTAYTSSDIITNVSITGYRACDATGCLEIPDGGAFNSTPGSNVSIEMRYAGYVDTYPISPPGVANKAVYGRAVLPNITKTFTRTSGPDGFWNGSMAGLWAHAPAAGCATVPTAAFARPAAQGHWETPGSLVLCVAPSAPS